MLRARRQFKAAGDAFKTAKLRWFRRSRLCDGAYAGRLNAETLSRFRSRNRAFDSLGRVVDDAQEIAGRRVGLPAPLFPIAHGRGRKTEFLGEAVLRQAKPFADRRHVRRSGRKARAGLASPCAIAKASRALPINACPNLLISFALPDRLRRSWPGSPPTR